LCKNVVLGLWRKSWSVLLPPCHYFILRRSSISRSADGRPAGAHISTVEISACLFANAAVHIMSVFTQYVCSVNVFIVYTLDRVFLQSWCHMKTNVTAKVYRSSNHKLGTCPAPSRLFQSSNRLSFCADYAPCEGLGSMRPSLFTTNVCSSGRKNGAINSAMHRCAAVQLRSCAGVSLCALRRTVSRIPCEDEIGPAPASLAFPRFQQCCFAGSAGLWSFWNGFVVKCTCQNSVMPRYS